MSEFWLWKSDYVTRWTLPEFLFEMEMDITRRVLFVEGLRDLAFWRALVPPSARGDAVIYPISFVEFDSGERGERGRMLRIASAISGSTVSMRVLFFADADHDRLLGREPGGNVVLTDGRDLESYGLTERCVGNLCVRGIALDEAAVANVFDQAINITRPIGCLRIACARANLPLPFQKTLDKRRSRKFITTTHGIAEVDVERLITTMLQNAGISLTKAGGIENLLAVEQHALKDVEHEQVVHGKDFIMALSYILQIDDDQIGRLLFLSMTLSEVASRPNVARVRGWMMQSAASG